MVVAERKHQALHEAQLGALVLYLRGRTLQRRHERVERQPAAGRVGQSGTQGMQRDR